MKNLPEKHIYENQKLVADGYVDLYEFLVNSGGEYYFLRLKENNSVDWGIDYTDADGTQHLKHWQGIPLKFEGWENSTLGSPKRPQFVCGNPNGVFSGYIRNGALVGAMMTRYRVLADDIVNGREIYLSQKWRVWSVKSFTKASVSLELRSPMDGYNVKLPPRTYRPPEFPVLSLK